MANGTKESKEEIFRKMEETTRRLMEEYKFVDAATRACSSAAKSIIFLISRNCTVNSYDIARLHA